MDVENEIKKIFLEVFPTIPAEKFEWNKKQKEYESWDSFAHLHIITLVEERLSLTLSVDESTSIDSAKKLLECVRSHQ